MLACRVKPAAGAAMPHPGFMVMKKPTRGSRETVDPSVNVNCLRRSRIALSTQYT